MEGGKQNDTGNQKDGKTGKGHGTPGSTDLLNEINNCFTQLDLSDKTFYTLFIFVLLFYL